MWSSCQPVSKERAEVTNRKLADIVKDQTPLLLAEHETVQQACCRMWERSSGSVLVVDDQQRLTGIFTGRDAVRALAEGKMPKSPRSRMP